MVLATRWCAPRIWVDQTVAILGGGKSCTQERVDFIKGKCRVIAINNSYQIAPWADILYFCDRKWHNWHKDDQRFKSFAGWIVTLENYDLGYKSLHNMGQHGLYGNPDGVMTGRNSGIQAVNLAVHMGVSRILLLGYDMKPGHWHGGHPKRTRPEVYADSMLPCFPAVAEELKARGITCINCSPGSELKDFPHEPIENCLADNTIALRGSEARADSGRR